MSDGKTTVSDDGGAEELYPIRTVSSLTGVNPMTLRAWERRYGLVRPQRTAKGHRLYSRDDIDYINRVLAQLEKGVPVSRVRDALTPPVASTTAAGEPDRGAWQRYRQQMVAAVVAFDEQRLDDVYNETLSLYPVAIVTRRLLLPLLQELGDRWASSEGGVAEEHFFSVYLRNKLGARFHHRNRGNTGPLLLAACLPGEQHEIGLLLFALSAHERGYRLVLLGANMPLEELPQAARRTRCDAVVLSGSVIEDKTLFDKAMPSMMAETRVPVFVGGAVSASCRDRLHALGAIPVGDDVAEGLRHINEHLLAAEPSKGDLV